MTLLAATFTAFGVADLIRGDSRALSCRAAVAVLLAVGLAGGLARLAGLGWSTVAPLAAAEALLLVVWVALEAHALRPLGASLALVWLVAAPSVALAASGAVPAVAGSLAEWYSHLAITRPSGPAAPDRLVVALGAGLFLMATANRLVRLVLVVAGTPTKKAETTLRGGRLIGPMERLFIGAMLVAGEPSGIAVVIAAKGLLRFQEIQKTTAPADIDEVTEYLLIGTLASMLAAIAAAAAVLVVG